MTDQELDLKKCSEAKLNKSETKGDLQDLFAILDSPTDKATETCSCIANDCDQTTNDDDIVTMNYSDYSKLMDHLNGLADENSQLRAEIDTLV